MTSDSRKPPDDEGRQGMTDRHQGRHGGAEYDETVLEEEEEAPPTCVCPKCGYVIPGDEETVCTHESCPKCGSILHESIP